MASKGINKVMIIGNLGADPETRYTANGTAVSNIRVATSDTWKDKTSGEMQERTEWHRIVFFGRLGEIAGEYLRKGSKVYVEGKLQTRKWQDNNGNDRYATEINGLQMQMLDSRQGGGNVQQGNFGGNQQSSAPQQKAPPGPQPEYQQQMEGMGDDLDDDIPF